MGLDSQFSKPITTNTENIYCPLLNDLIFSSNEVPVRFFPEILAIGTALHRLDDQGNFLSVNFNPDIREGQIIRKVKNRRTVDKIFSPNFVKLLANVVQIYELTCMRLAGGVEKEVLAGVFLDLSE